jgi:hypothetical protein
MCVIGQLMMLAEAFYEGHFVRSLLILSPGTILSGLAAGYLGKVMLDRARLKRRAC